MGEDLQNILGKFSANQDHTLSIWASKDPIVVQQVTQFGEVYRTKFCLKLQNYQKYDSSLLVGAVAYLVQCLAQCGQTCKENLDRGVYFRDGWYFFANQYLYFFFILGMGGQGRGRGGHRDGENSQ